MQSAIGRVALRKVPGWVETRRKYAAILNEYLADVRGLRIAIPPANVYHAYYKYYAFVEPAELQSGWDRDRIMQAICARGVPCFVGSCSEIYREKAFVKERRKQPRLPVAKELGETSLMFLVHPTLSEEDVQRTCRAVAEVMVSAAAPTVVVEESTSGLSAVAASASD
jgi:dTDP-4-amino-4,6-dideoxygalactose transaminase